MLVDPLLLGEPLADRLGRCVADTDVELDVVADVVLDARAEADTFVADDDTETSDVNETLGEPDSESVADRVPDSALLPDTRALAESVNVPLSRVDADGDTVGLLDEDGDVD